MKSNVRVSAALLALLLACAVITLMTIPAAAAVVDLGKGWQASWDPSWDAFVHVQTVLSLDNDVLIIRKAAEFTHLPVNGVFPPIPITFLQTSPVAANYIVIEDEAILNSTGIDWTDFHIDLLGGKAVFDPGLTASSGGPDPIGWDIAPFAKAAFTTLKRLDVWDGVVPKDWWPGAGATGGQLWLRVFPDPDVFAWFTLKENPTPEPATVCLLALGGVALLTRRGRRVAG